MRKCCFIIMVAIVFAAVFCFPPQYSGKTTFLADYEQGLDAAYAAGDPKAVFSVRAPRDSIRLIPDGRFGRGLFLDRDVREFMFGYNVRSNFCYEHGTLEFWFRPEHDSNYKGDDDPEWMKSSAASSFILFSTGEPPFGYRLHKNQYNYFSFYFFYSYKQQAEVGCIAPGKLFWEKGVWTHVAVAWDEQEARLFLDGRLIACTDEWDVKKPFESPFFLSGWGAFDDVRISDGKLYVSSFAVPSAPLAAQKMDALPPENPVLTAAERADLERENVTFYADYSRSMTAIFARGAPDVVSNSALEFNGPPAGDRALRLRRTGWVPEATLAYKTADNISRFLGAVEIIVQPAATNVWPVVLFDCSDLETTKSMRAQRQGMRLMLKDAATLEWQNLAGGRVVATVNAPVKLAPQGWNRLGFSWRGSTLTLLQDGQPVRQEVGVPLPYKLPAHFFIGSDSQGTTNIFDGWIKAVKIYGKQL